MTSERDERRMRRSVIAAVVPMIRFRPSLVAPATAIMRRANLVSTVVGGRRAKGPR